MKAGSSESKPLCGRKYKLTPDGTDACRVLTCRAIFRSAAQPLATSAESSYAPAKRTAVLLGDRGQGFQRPAQPVAVQQHARHPEQLGDRGRRRPPGDVIQR